MTRKIWMTFAVALMLGTPASLKAGQLGGTLSSVQPRHFSSLANQQSTQTSDMNETVLYSFKGAPDGASPWELTLGADGHLYGVTSGGGSYDNGCGYPDGCGTIFELTPYSGGWTEQVIHTFTYDDGDNPWTGLAKDSQGNLYGTTLYGGRYTRGTVFELIRPRSPDGAWTLVTLHAFGANDSDGWYPVGPLQMDDHGNLFGVTNSNNGTARGTVFEVSPSTGGQWTEKVIYLFNSLSGYDPNGGLIMKASGVNNPNEPAGALYGTTVVGGPSGKGTVFQLVPPMRTARWTLNMLHGFSGGSDGDTPGAGLYMDANGNLFGTTIGGGSSNYGTAFEVSPPAQAEASWTEKVIHNFSLANGDGIQPESVPVGDPTGSLYITTTNGGSHYGGAVVKLSPAGLNWNETVLHAFNGDDGSEPTAGLLKGPGGTFYGTTTYGGSHYKGVVYQLQ